MVLDGHYLGLFSAHTPFHNVSEHEGALDFSLGEMG